MRGLAALIVVVHHTLLLAPWGQSGDYPGLLDPLMHTDAARYLPLFVVSVVIAQ